MEAKRFILFFYIFSLSHYDLTINELEGFLLLVHSDLNCRNPVLQIFSGAYKLIINLEGVVVREQCALLEFDFPQIALCFRPHFDRLRAEFIRVQVFRPFNAQPVL